MFPVTALLVAAAFILALASTSGRVPLWPAVLCLAIAELLQIWPAR